jgi:WD40 repeat protein
MSIIASAAFQGSANSSELLPMKTAPLHARPWHSDFMQAVFVSTAVVACLTGLLAACRSHKRDDSPSDLRYSITDCLISSDGRHALLTYRRADERREGLHYVLATVDLTQSVADFVAVPSVSQPSRLARTSRDAALVVDASGQTALHDVISGKTLVTKSTCLPHNHPAYVAQSPDGRLVVTWDTNRLVAFDVVKREIRWQREGSEVTCAVFHPHAGLFAACQNKVVQLSLESGAIVRTLANRNERIRQMALDGRGAAIAWLDWAGAIEVCRVRDGKSMWIQRSHGGETLPATHRASVYSGVLAFSEDGRYLATCAYEGEWVIAVWNVKSGDRLKSLRGHDKVVNGATFLRDGTLASWATDGTLRLWNVKRGAVRRILSARELVTG